MSTINLAAQQTKNIQKNVSLKKIYAIHGILNSFVEFQSILSFSEPIQSKKH